MKKYLTLAFIFAVALTFMAYGQNNPTSRMVKGKIDKTEGWVNENTYRVVATGAPDKDLKDKAKRKESSEKAAVLNAQSKVLEGFKNEKVESTAVVRSNYKITSAPAKELEEQVKGGSVKSKTWDKNDNCEVVYEVQTEGLKKKVSTGIWK